MPWKNIEKSYIITREAYYFSYSVMEDFEKRRISDELLINVEDTQINVVWKYIGNERVPEIQMFNDTWSAFVIYPELFAALGALDSTDPSPERLTKMLDSLGFEDKTEREKENNQQTSWNTSY